MTDTDRLNWLIKQGPPGAAEGMGLNAETWDVAVGFADDPDGTDQIAVRAAIDAGIRAEPEWAMGHREEESK